MRGNRRWYGGPVWAVVMMVALALSTLAPVLAEPPSPETEVPAPEVQVLTDAPIEESAAPNTGTGGDEAGPAQPQENEPGASTFSPAADDAAEEIPQGDKVPTDETDDPIVDPGEGDDGNGFDPTDLSISLAGPAAVDAGVSMTYTVTVTNSRSVSVGEMRFSFPNFSNALGTGWIGTVSGAETGACALTVNESTSSVRCWGLNVPAGGTVAAQITGSALGAAIADCGATYRLVALLFWADGAVARAGGPGWTSDRVETTITCPAMEPEDEPEPVIALQASLTGPTEVRAGFSAAFVTGVTNSGDAVGSVQISTVFPSLTHDVVGSSVSGSEYGGVSCVGTAIRSCTISNLAAGGSVFIETEIMARDRATAPCGEVQSVTAAISDVDAPVSSRQPGFSARLDVTVDCPGAPEKVVDPADLSIAISGPATVTASGVQSYIVTVTNAGDVPVAEMAFQVSKTLEVLGDSLHAQVLPGSGAGQVTCTPSAMVTSCRADDLPAGGVLQVQGYGMVLSPASALAVCDPPMVVTPAITWADGMDSAEGGAGWTSAPISTTATCVDSAGDPEELQITIGGPTSAVLGETLTYTVSFKNSGDTT